MNSIQEYNTNLADKLIKYEHDEYFKIVHSKFYSHINIEFMDYFLSLIYRENEFCVDQSMLLQYKVINTNNKSSDILRALKQYDLVENEDYLMCNVAQHLKIL